MKRRRLDFRNLFEITLCIQSAFWGEPLQSATVDGDLQSIVQDQNNNMSLERFDRTFFALSSLALSDSLETYGGDLIALLAQVWDECIETQYLSLLIKQTWFANFTHLSMELVAQTPFLILYSHYSAKSLDSVAYFAPRTRFSAERHSSRCMR